MSYYFILNAQFQHLYTPIQKCLGEKLWGFKIYTKCSLFINLGKLPMVGGFDLYIFLFILFIYLAFSLSGEGHCY